MGDDEPPTLSMDLVKEVNGRCARALYAASQLPKLGSGYELYNINPKYHELQKGFRTRIIKLMQNVLRFSGYAMTAHPRFDDMSELIRPNDFLLERAHTELDIYENSQKSYNFTFRSSTGEVCSPMDPVKSEAAGPYALLSVSKTAEKTIQKPQRLFFDSIMNGDRPFVPKLKLKHNAIQRAEKLTVECDSALREWPSDLTSDPHPYHFELIHLEIPPLYFTNRQPITYKRLDETPLVMVETVEALEELIKMLNSVTEFAVDLEHHSHRSFLGLTCLIQISTRNIDYIIDPFPIWKEMFRLNEPFTDPKIMKVFHGADSDIIWLQRDFGVYAVNMMDTHVLMKLLEMPKRSLQALVSEYCGIELNKRLQKSDWRVRPLTGSHLEYARSDSHYLLYCCDRLMQLITEREMDVSKAFNESKAICLQQFEQPRFDPMGYMSLLLRAKRSLNTRQIFALKSLWAWRDQTARAEDESLQYVLPDHTMLHIAEVLPREIQGIMACCSPVPPLLKRDLFAIHQYISLARDQPLAAKEEPLKNELNSAALADNTRTQQSGSSVYTKEIARIDCRFDQSEFRVDDIRHDLLTNRIPETDRVRIVLKNHPLLPFKCFTGITKTNASIGLEKVLRSIKEWEAPYEQYLIGLSMKEKVDSNSTIAVRSEGFSHRDPSSSEPTTERSIDKKSANADEQKSTRYPYRRRKAPINPTGQEKRPRC